MTIRPYYFILFLLYALLPSTFFAEQWKNPTPDTLTSFVYAPGVLVSEMLMGRYCPQFIASTGETITCSKGIEVITTPASSCNFSEITLKHVNKKGLKRKRQEAQHQRTGKQIFIGLVLTPFRALWYTASYIANWAFGISVTPPKGQRVEKSLSMYWADPTKVNLAQDKDIAIFKNTYETHLTSLQDQDNRYQNVILYGTSRGSATVFNFCALYKPQHVRALVCEGLFDSIEHIYTATKSRRIRALVKLLPKVSEFSHDGLLPVKVADQIPLEMPVLLVTSHKDNTVPYECTMNIYTMLRATGHHNVHILVCKKASHIGYPSGKEKYLYESVTHAFYRKYNLPHIPEKANEGEEYFQTMTQPNY